MIQYTCNLFCTQVIPSKWRRLLGVTAPPVGQPLISLINDLQNRTQHFEKILVLVNNI